MCGNGVRTGMVRILHRHRQIRLVLHRVLTACIVAAIGTMVRISVGFRAASTATITYLIQKATMASGLLSLNNSQISITAKKVAESGLFCLVHSEKHELPGVFIVFVYSATQVCASDPKLLINFKNNL